MDIEKMSMNMSQTQLVDAVSTKVLSMAMDMAEQGGAGLVEMMEESMMEMPEVPGLGTNLDLKI